MPKKPDNPRPWTCPNGHLIGHVERDRSGPKLILYEVSVDPRWPRRDSTPTYRGTVRGPATIRCTVCRADKEWFPEGEALERLLKGVRKTGGSEESEHAAIRLTPAEDMA